MPARNRLRARRHVLTIGGDSLGIRPLGKPDLPTVARQTNKPRRVPDRPELSVRRRTDTSQDSSLLLLTTEMRTMLTLGNPCLHAARFAVSRLCVQSPASLGSSLRPKNVSIPPEVCGTSAKSHTNTRGTHKQGRAAANPKPVRPELSTASFLSQIGGRLRTEDGGLR
ncbi:hypothetical protein Bbelb_364990 [Branchiostoma belcheri]|nr:hypothetical protein Bbelb_364990 [Branchiostoma belcheri]